MCVLFSSSSSYCVCVRENCSSRNEDIAVTEWKQFNDKKEACRKIHCDLGNHDIY
jgi:hypothetical protein